MKLLLTTFLLLMTQVFAEPRPMTIRLTDEGSPFGRVAFITCFIKEGESMLMKWTGDLNSPFQFLAGSGPSPVDGNYVATAPGDWYTGHVFVSCDGIVSKEKSLTAEPMRFVKPLLALRFEKSSTPTKWRLTKHYRKMDTRKGSELLMTKKKQAIVVLPPPLPTRK